MALTSQRPVAKSELSLQPYECLQRVNWDDLKVFLVCTEFGSLREAARRLRVNPSTITRRIERLEADLSLQLFNRAPEGIVLTEIGRSIAANARNMEQALLDLWRAQASVTAGEGAVRVSIAVTEGLGSFWVLPRLVEFQRENPNIGIDLQCSMHQPDILRLEAEIGLGFGRPERADLVAQRVGRFHLYPFASQGYLDIYGVPRSYDDLDHHRFVQQVTPELDNAAFAAYFRLKDPQRSITVRTNTSTAHLYAIEKGAGIGGLPTFASCLGAPVVPIDIGPGYGLDIWLTHHPDARKSPHTSIVIDFLRSSFDASVFPWFRRELIHPLALKAPPQASPVNIGQGFLAVDPVTPMWTSKFGNGSMRGW